nr:hypothetical protein [Tanacetum cinerariifolium]
MEEDEDAEIIFPYEVQGDQTPPPRDESSDSDSEPEAKDADDELEVEEAGVEPEVEGADVELEAEEPDGVPDAAIGAGSQRPFAIRDFSMGVYEIGESSTARDPQFVGSLAPWALRRDLEALRRHERIREAESETSRTEVALLGSDAKIEKMEREILHHDLSSVEETLGKVVERLKIVIANPNPRHLLDYDEEEDPEMGIEEEEPEEEPVEEPKPLPRHGDQFDAHPNPRPGNMNGWVDDDDDVEEEEDEENKDVDMEEDDDAEIIFPYEVQGDQTPPPRDESFVSDSKPEAEEADDEPEAEDADDE